MKDFYTLNACQEALKGMGDLARIASRVVGRNGSPRDVRAFGSALARLPAIKSVIDKVGTAYGRLWIDDWDNLTDVAALIERAIDDEAPNFARDGGMIRKGYCGGIQTFQS